MKQLRSLAMWMVWNVPLGWIAPHVMSFAMNSRAVRVQPKQEAT